MRSAVTRAMSMPAPVAAVSDHASFSASMVSEVCQLSRTAHTTRLSSVYDLCLCWLSYSGRSLFGGRLRWP